MVSIFVGTGSVLRCWQILVFTSAYALNFINRRFGSLFWLLRVPIGSLFHEKLGPYWVPIFKHEGPYKFGEQWNNFDILNTIFFLDCFGLPILLNIVHIFSLD